ncbi:methylase of polypeptide chain release factors [Candidatus Scalindua japonica]|uniref:Methylase of polypeptide chain release factors n=1 Tax=Candidatus Scalindua japonica TaxID=1284222 RepID=A0A286U0S3_9BACT|nr:BREX-3 system phosphatase PglZ [Candidatus Scalindua japonica]GAX61718.1 methylase of polypeptide chain release factors [Candidatus Scalindua japonica]
MNSWRDTILNEFVPKISRLTIVSDPDALLTEEKLAVTLRERGFDLIEFNDAIEFRYAYESNYRIFWDQEKHTDLVVVLRLQDTEVDNLPFDLLKAGRRLSFDLGSIFPNLSYPVIEKLDRSLLDTLFDAQQNYSPGRIGDNATKDFILSHVFGIAAELIKSDADLLRILLRIHYNSLSIPGELIDRLVQVLSGHKAFAGWPLADVIPDENAFFAFLQERWPIFLSGLHATDQVGEVSEGYGLKHHGPDSLPFDHQDIRVYIDNLFVEGKLTPVAADTIGFDINTLQGDTWIKSGIADTGKNEGVRITRLLDLIVGEGPTEDSRYSDWTSLAFKWAELATLIHNDSTKEHRDCFLKLGDSLNKTFTDWLNNHYAGLINLPPTNPVMLHHVSRKMARELEDSQCAGVALVVLDGLALDQWIPLKHVIQEQAPDITFRETAVFAWVPTLTSVSRQTIFAGKEPLYFPNSINTTNNEQVLWRQFWENHGLSRLDISYKRGLGDGDPIVDLEPVFNPGRTKAIGLVVDKVDKIMHGMQLGAAGMHNQIRQWSKQGYLSALIKYLLEMDYHIWLTSDHGNIECNGKGRPSEGSIAETCGERARVYPTPELRSKVLSDHISAKEWRAPGLPADYYPLVAEGRDAFIKEGDSIVGHGGISIEEIIVPLVKIERRTR